MYISVPWVETDQVLGPPIFCVGRSLIGVASQVDVLRISADVDTDMHIALYWPQFSWYGLLDAFLMLETIRIKEYVCCQREHAFLNALSSRSEAGLVVCPNLRRFHIGGRWSLGLTEEVTRCFALRAQQVSKLEALIFASKCTLAFPANDQARIALYRELFVGAKTVEIHTESSVICLKEDSDVIAMGSMPSAFKGKVRCLSKSGIVDVLFLPL